MCGLPAAPYRGSERGEEQTGSRGWRREENRDEQSQTYDQTQSGRLGRNRLWICRSVGWMTENILWLRSCCIFYQQQQQNVDGWRCCRCARLFIFTYFCLHFSASQLLLFLVNSYYFIQNKADRIFNSIAKLHSIILEAKLKILSFDFRKKRSKRAILDAFENKEKESTQIDNKTEKEKEEEKGTTQSKFVKEAEKSVANVEKHQMMMESPMRRNVTDTFILLDALKHHTDYSVRLWNKIIFSEILYLDLCLCVSRCKCARQFMLSAYESTTDHQDQIIR